jgi:hypothetical protein
MRQEITVGEEKKEIRKSKTPEYSTAHTNLKPTSIFTLIPTCAVSCTRLSCVLTDRSQGSCFEELPLV